MTLYLFPTEMEAAPFRKLCPDAEVVISGVGMVATAATVAKLLVDGRLGAGCSVVLAGIAGGYSEEDVRVGEVVEVVRERVVELPERFAKEYVAEAATSLRGVCSNTIHRSVAATGAAIENMEGAALFAMAEQAGFRAIEIRAVSNIVGEPFERWRVVEAIDALAAELLTFYKSFDYE